MMSVVEFSFLSAYPTPLRAALHNCGDTIRCILDDSGADTEIVALLLEYGASVRLRDAKRRPILHVAVETNRADLVNMVLDHGAPVDARDETGMTALAMTILRHPVGALGNPEASIAKLLVQRGASLVGMCDWDAVDSDGASLASRHLVPLTPRSRVLAVTLASKEVALPEGGSAKWAETTTDLHLACFIHDDALFEAVLDKTLDLDGKDAVGLTAFEYCAIIRDHTRMEILLARGADIHCVDKLGRSLLHRAVLAERVDLIEFLVKNGEDINRRIIVPDDYDPLAEILTDSDDGGTATSSDDVTVGGIMKAYATKSELTALQLAILTNKRDSISALLAQDAAHDAFRYPAMPLYFGAIRHGTALVEELLSAGCKARPQDTTWRAISTFAGVLCIDLENGTEALAKSIEKSLGWILSDLVNLHPEEDLIAVMLLRCGLENYQDSYIQVSSMDKSFLGWVEEAIKKLESNQSETDSTDGGLDLYGLPPRSRSSSMLVELGSTGVFAKEPPAIATIPGPEEAEEAKEAEEAEEAELDGWDSPAGRVPSWNRSLSKGKDVGSSWASTHST